MSSSLWIIWLKLLFCAQTLQAEIWNNDVEVFDDDSETNANRVAFMKKNLSKRLNNENEDSPRAIRPWDWQTSNIFPFLHPTPHCSCGMEPDVVDIGPHFYPRHLRTGFCKSERCGGIYKCLPRYYEMIVLKRRDPKEKGDEDVNFLPELLKASWQPEKVNVTVACECSLGSSSLTLSAV